MTLSLKEAKAVIYSLSRPSKMPGFCWSIPAIHCKVGSALAAVPGTVCSFCYARKGRYAFPATKLAMERRMQGLADPRWEEAMAIVLSTRAVSSKKVFRWFDSGDLQSVDHLRRIVAVCVSTPFLKHWLPTREVGVVSTFQKEGGAIPDNMIIRLSAPMVDGGAPSTWVWSSGVHLKTTPSGYICPASTQGHVCGSCRACWDRAITHVSYPWH